MGYDSSRFPDPYRSRSDASHASVFLVTLLLLLAVGYILFAGSSWIFAPVDAISSASASSVARLAGVRSTAGPAPTFVAPTTVPPLAGVVIQPSPTATVRGATPAPSPASPPPAQTPPVAGPPPVAPPATPPPGTTPASAALPGSSAVPPPQATIRVGNTNGDGVFLRHTPRLADHWLAWPDNTPLVFLGGVADGDGQHWLQVRDPKGDVGWVPTEYVVG